MSSFVVLVGLQFYILFFIQENFVIADEKTSLETSKQQVVGQCGDRKSDPLDTKIHWKDACYDFDGNSYKDGDFLMSCCGCFKFICSNKTKEDPPCDDKYGWDKVLEATCCEDCHGQVFPAGSVIKEQKLEDKCSTTVTTKCVLASGEKKATIDESLSYEKCCINSSGVYTLNTSVLVPALCSVRVCSRPAGRHEASWTLTKKTTGCDCCQYRGKLIADKDWVIIGKGHKARNATCCEGKLLVSIDDEDVSSTTSEDETVSITTNGDKEIGITQEVEKSTRSGSSTETTPTNMTTTTTTKAQTVLWIAKNDKTPETLKLPDFTPVNAKCKVPNPNMNLYQSNTQEIQGKLYICDHRLCQTYSAEDNTWKTIPGKRFKFPRWYTAGTVIGDKWIVQGGQVHGKYINVATAEVWSPGTGNWVEAPQYKSPLPVHHHCLVNINGKIMQIGGLSYALGAGTGKCFVDGSEVASLKAPRYLHSCAVFHGEVWVAGGYRDDKNKDARVVEIYNPQSKSWAEGAKL